MPPLRLPRDLYKDHFYAGMAHAMILEKLYPDTRCPALFGCAQQCSGGMKPHAVIMRSSSAARSSGCRPVGGQSHRRQGVRAGQEASRRPRRRCYDPIPLDGLDANGQLTDDTKKVIDLIAEATSSCPAAICMPANCTWCSTRPPKRGVKKMMVNHPTYVVGCTDDDIRQLVGLGVVMEHSICMFIEGKSKNYSPMILPI